jgi:hypothetical protein
MATCSTGAGQGAGERIGSLAQPDFMVCCSPFDMPNEPGESSEVRIRVLSASIDPHLNEARALLLRHHGFEVVSTESKESAVERIQKDSFQVLIFGNTLPRDTCWELAEVFRKYNATGRIIEIVPSQELSEKGQNDGCAREWAAPLPSLVDVEEF